MLYISKLIWVPILIGNPPFPTTLPTMNDQRAHLASAQLARSMCIGILRLYVMLGYWSTYGLVLKVFDNAMQAHG